MVELSKGRPPWNPLAGRGVLPPSPPHGGAAPPQLTLGGVRCGTGMKRCLFESKRQTEFLYSGAQHPRSCAEEELSRVYFCTSTFGFRNPPQLSEYKWKSVLPRTERWWDLRRFRAFHQHVVGNTTLQNVKRRVRAGRGKEWVRAGEETGTGTGEETGTGTGEETGAGEET
eukprot:gene12486-biopygen4943